MTNHTLEKPNDWWRLHLPFVISLKSTHIPIMHPRYDTPPYYSRTKIRERHASFTSMGGQAAMRRRHVLLLISFSFNPFIILHSCTLVTFKWNICIRLALLLVLLLTIPTYLDQSMLIALTALLERVLLSVIQMSRVIPFLRAHGQ